jgi:hypothetical protein
METITIYFFLTLTFFAGMFIDEIVKPTFFGIKLPDGYNKKENLIRLKREYKKKFSLSHLFIVLIYIVLTLKVTEIWSVVLGNLFILIEIVVIVVSYNIMYKKIKLLKASEKWKFESEKDTMDDKSAIMGFISYDKNNPDLFVNKGIYGVRPNINFANPFAKILLVILLVVVFLFFASTLTFPGNFQNRHVVVNNDSIIIEGVGGMTVNKAEITNVLLEKELPVPLRTIKGRTINKMKMGRYKLTKYEKGYYFIMDRTKPFIAIYTKGNNLIFINYENISKTEALYRVLGQVEE